MQTFVRKLLSVSMMLVAAALATGQATAAETIRVGAYQFEPFVDGDKGVTPDLIGLLNRLQSDFHFTLVPIPAQRRYQLMRTGAIDMLMFEMPGWGWADAREALEVTAPLLSGHEVFVVRAGDWPRGTPSEDRLKRQMALTLGYHYAFAGFDADQKVLKSQFNVVFAETQTNVLKYLAAGTADIAIVSDMFLACAEKRDPALVGTFEIVPPHDQDYHLPLMVRTGARIKAVDLTRMLDRLKRSGELRRLFKEQGLGRFLVY